MKTIFFIFTFFFITLNLSCQVNYKTPGVYLEETPSSSASISSLPTDQVIFIGHSEKGSGSKKQINSINPFHE